MAKGLMFILIIILALTSISGYIYLTEEITAGKLKIALGQKQLADGEKMLAQGKGRLAEGRRSVSQAKNLYNGIKSVPFMGIADKLPVSGTLFSVADSKISEGSDLVNKGNEKIKSGESQLSEGKSQLRKGEARLQRANLIKNVCAIGAILFSILAIVLGYCWRKSLFTFRKKSKPPLRQQIKNCKKSY